MGQVLITPEYVGRKKEQWQEYRKTKTVKATIWPTPFTCHTQEGFVTLGEDQGEYGYVAVDSHGYPYPIDKDEFEAIYEKVEGG